MRIAAGVARTDQELEPHNPSVRAHLTDCVGAQWELRRALARTDQRLGGCDAPVSAHVDRRCSRVTALLGCFSK
jgi:hypothetical protein